MKYFRLIIMMFGLCFASVTLAKDFYVNPIGNDSWSGTLKQPNMKRNDGPFKTIERAKQIVKTLKQNKAFNDKLIFHIAAGHYFLTHPLVFNLFDSGVLDKEILWQGETGGKVVISGGIPMTCRKMDAKLWECPLMQTPQNKEVYDMSRNRGEFPKFEFYVNEKKMELARWPDQDWAHIKLPLDEKTQFTTIEKLPTLKGDNKSGRVHIFSGNDWYDQYAGLASYNSDLNTIELSSKTNYRLTSGYRFYIQNLLSALDAPGEWFYDQQNKRILFIPPINFSPDQAIVSSLTNVIIVDNSNFLKFDNLTIQHSAGAAIKLKNASHVTLEQLNINNAGSVGVEINGGDQVSINSSDIHNTGATAIIVSGGDSKQLKPSGHLINNNHIHDMGTVLLTSSSPGVHLYGVGTKITHNLLEQGSGPAIIIEGNDHKIEKNVIHHFCLQSSDCGAVYSGRNSAWRGNLIRYNHIHDITGYGLESVDLSKNTVKYRSPADARGVYLDDGASGFEVTGNIFENIGRIAVSIGGGRDNKIHNNYFNTNAYAVMVDDRSSLDWRQNQKHLESLPYKSEVWRRRYPELAAAAAPMPNYNLPEGNRIERNIFVSTKPGGYALKLYIPRKSTVISKNLVWAISGDFNIEHKLLESKTVKYDTWKNWLSEKIENGSIYADPCVTITNHKMNACKSTPIKEIGFIPLPNDIGPVNH